MGGELNGGRQELHQVWGGDPEWDWEGEGNGGVLKQTNTEMSEIEEQVRISSFRTCSESGNSMENIERIS